MRGDTGKRITSLLSKPIHLLLHRPVPGPLALWYLSNGVREVRDTCSTSARCRRLRTFLHCTVQVCAKVPTPALKELVWLTYQHCAEMLTDVLEVGTSPFLHAPNSSTSWAQLETAKQHDHGGTGNLWENNCYSRHLTNRKQAETSGQWAKRDELHLSVGYWAAGHGGLFILPADILSCCGEQPKNLFHLPAAHIEARWEQEKCAICWTLGFAASPGVQRAVSVLTRDFWRCFLSRKVWFLIESNSSIWLTAVFLPKNIFQLKCIALKRHCSPCFAFVNLWW